MSPSATSTHTYRGVFFRDLFITVMFFTVMSLSTVRSRCADCNENDIDDTEDIATEFSNDCNGNGMPDECEIAPPDDVPVPEPIRSLAFVEERIDLESRYEPHSSVVIDLDGDGRLDIVTNDGEERLMVLMGDGEGNFAVGPIYSLDNMSEIIWIVSEDFDGDGNPDIAAVDESTDFLAVLLGDGEGGLDQVASLDVGRSLKFLDSADFDGDGDPDLIFADQGAGTINQYSNRGDGSFDEVTRFVAGNLPVGLVTGDFDGQDGPDVAVIGASRLTIFLGDDSGGLLEPTVHEVATARFVAAGDLDDDGDLDLALAQTGADRVSLFENDGQGAFSARDRFDWGRGPRSVMIVDVDGDGLNDLVTGNERSDSVSVSLNRGKWQFDPPRVQAVGEDPRFVFSGDLDRDGKLEIIVANHTSHDFSILSGQEALVYFPPLTTSVCTPLEFHAVSAPGESGGALRRWARCLVPVPGDPPSELETLLSNAGYGSQLEFLQAIYPGDFGDLGEEEFLDLVGHRSTRRYYTGTVSKSEIEGAEIYGFDVFVETSDAEGGSENLEQVEVFYIMEELQGVFSLGELVYLPRSREAREAAASWKDPPFPVLVTSDLFRRGDGNQDGVLNLTDSIFILSYLFQAGSAPLCEASADVNDDGSVDLSDAITVLVHLFLAGASPPPPFASCGLGPGPNGLGCERYALCDAGGPY